MRAKILTIAAFTLRGTSEALLLVMTAAAGAVIYAMALPPEARQMVSPLYVAIVAAVGGGFARLASWGAEHWSLRMPRPGVAIVRTVTPSKLCDASQIPIELVGLAYDGRRYFWSTLAGTYRVGDAVEVTRAGFWNGGQIYPAELATAQVAVAETRVEAADPR